MRSKPLIRIAIVEQWGFQMVDNYLGSLLRELGSAVVKDPSLPSR